MFKCADRPDEHVIHTRVPRRHLFQTTLTRRRIQRHGINRLERQGGVGLHQVFAAMFEFASERS